MKRRRCYGGILACVLVAAFVAFWKELLRTEKVASAIEGHQLQKVNTTSHITGDHHSGGQTFREGQLVDNYAENVPPSEEQVPVPRFFRDYIDFHNRFHPLSSFSFTTKTESGAETPKYLVWQCGASDERVEDISCGGLGDRLKGIISAFYTAVCSQRLLLIDWPNTTGIGLDHYLHPHKIEWRLPPNDWTTHQRTSWKPIGKFKQMHSYGSTVLKDLRVPMKLSHEKIVTIMTNRWYQDELQDHHWYGGRPRNSTWYANNSQCLQTRLWSQQIQDDDKQPYHYRNLLQDEHYLFRTAFDILFQFSNAVIQRTRTIQTTSRLLKSQQSALTAAKQEDTKTTSSSSSLSSSSMVHSSLSNHYIAIHVRAGGQLSTFEDPGRHTSHDDYRKFYICAKRFQAGIWERQRQTCRHGYGDQAVPQIANSEARNLVPIYVASDDASAKQYLQDLEQREQDQSARTSSIRTLPNLTLYHIDKSHKSSAMRNNGTLKYDGELTVWAELKVLMEATCLVTSTSGFSQLATWLQKGPTLSAPHRCAIHFEDCEQEELMRDALDTLIDFGC